VHVSWLDVDADERQASAATAQARRARQHVDRDSAMSTWLRAAHRLWALPLCATLGAIGPSPKGPEMIDLARIKHKWIGVHEGKLKHSGEY
jgi:hypothetical protein